MDLSSPISSVIPTAHGAVLTVLARRSEPLSGRGVAELTRGRFGQWRVNEVLGELADAGLVLREERPPSKLYRLNREHVAAAGIEALAGQWTEFLARIRGELASWALAPEAGWLFGSAARGEAGNDSDVDILLITPLLTAADISATTGAWTAQVARLSDRVRAWSGNPCEVLELSGDELRAADKRSDRLVADLCDHAVTLTDIDVRSWLNQPHRHRKVRR